MNDGFSIDYLAQNYALKEKIKVDGVEYNLKCEKTDTKDGRTLYVIGYAGKKGLWLVVHVNSYSFLLNSYGYSLSEARESLKREMVKIEKISKKFNAKPSLKKKKKKNLIDEN